MIERMSALKTLKHFAFIKSTFFILALGAFVQLGCQSSKEESVLIIAADNLISSDVTCTEETRNVKTSGFALLCEQGVRFTHAYTTSTMAVPALASLLSGLYPFQNNVRANNQELNPEIRTLAEAAYEQNFRTAFFSGGAPVLRKSGLHQGFQFFDDQFIPKPNELFKKFAKTSRAFLNFMNDEAAKQKFLSVLYVPDLLFTRRQTFSATGEPRPLSYESQLTEFDENLFSLFSEMKRRGRWDKTHVILLGLNGHNRLGGHEGVSALNLHSENTQVAMLIKPAVRGSKEPMSWKVDRPVSIADLGFTLQQILEPKRKFEQDDTFPLVDLNFIFSRGQPKWDSNRPLVIESGWAAWKYKLPVRVGVVAGDLLYLHNQSPQLYNMLTDHSEILPLSNDDGLWQQVNVARKELANKDFESWPNDELIQRVAKLDDYQAWLDTSRVQELLELLRQEAKKNSPSLTMLKWGEQISIENKDWASLLIFAKKLSDDEGVYLAKLYLNQRYETPESCLGDILQQSSNLAPPRSCNEKTITDFYSWQLDRQEGGRADISRLKFFKTYEDYIVDLQFARQNMALGQIWDMNQMPVPSVFTKFLSLPSNKKLQAEVMSATTSLNSVTDQEQ